MSNNTSTDKKYCYRYHDGNDDQGRPIVTLWKRVIIRETKKTFWHVDDMPHMSLEQLIAYRTGGSQQRAKHNVKRSLKGADRSRYHYTKEEALKAFVFRKTYQLERIQLTAETVSMCLSGLRDAGMVTGECRCTVENLPKGDFFIAAQEAGPIASNYSWGEY